MTPRRGVVLGLAALLLVSAGPASEPPVVRVRLVTSAGTVTLALDAGRAPLTVANFLRYVDD